MTRVEERCDCGRPLHYSEAGVEADVRALIALLGECMPIQIVGSELTYLVPRHYIALHGLAARDLPALAEKYGWRVR